MDRIIYDNFLYFKENILPYYILLDTYEGTIIIDSSESNLKHLLGLHKTSNLKFRKMSPSEVWEHLNNGNKINMFEIIDEERFNNDELTADEVHIYRKNIGFIPIFNSLFSEENLHFFTKTGGEFDADYVQYFVFKCLNGYLGIIGAENNYNHYFNSIMVKDNSASNFIGPKVTVSRVYKIPKSSFSTKGLVISYPNRYVKAHYKKSKNKHKKNIILNNHTIKEINKIIDSSLHISRGANGKKSIKIVKDGIVVEKGIKLNLQNFKSIQEVTEYINENYK